MGDFTVGINVALLVNPTNSLECSDIESALRAKIAEMFGLNFTMSLFRFLLALKCL